MSGKLNLIIRKILRMKSWNLGIVVLAVGIPFGLIHITRLQNAGSADDIGIWYRVYCALAYAVPYAIGVAVMHFLTKKFRDGRNL